MIDLWTHTVADSLLRIGSVGGGFAALGGAVTLGLRHGIDWDHIAAITDITSAATTVDEHETGLLREPSIQLTDEPRTAS